MVATDNYSAIIGNHSNVTTTSGKGPTRIYD